MPIGNKHSRMTTAPGRRTGRRTLYAPIRRRSAKRVARSELRMRRNNVESLDRARVREGEGMFEVILKRFEKPDETRVFEKGRFEIVMIGGMTVGRATYEPGWKWSEHVAPIAGASLCGVEHVGMDVSGRAVAAVGDGRVSGLSPGDLFYIPPLPHDSWVIGDEPYVSLHFLGADHYTR